MLNAMSFCFDAFCPGDAVDHDTPRSTPPQLQSCRGCRVAELMLLVPYLADCQLLRALAVALDLPPPCTTSALSLLHRVKACALPGGPQLTAQELVSACIFVASKIEEVNVSANHLINSARLLSHPSQRHLLHVLAPLNASLLQQQEQGEGTAPSAATATATARDTSHQQQPQLQSSPAARAPGENATTHQQQQQRQQDCQAKPPDLEKQGSLASHQQQQPQQPEQQQQQQSEPQQQQQQQLEEQQQPPAVVVGDGYYAAKDRLFIAEQVVLRLTSFQLAAEQPHKHLLNFCRLLGASRAAAAAAVCLLNDALGYTRLCLTTAAPVLAAAALQAAFELLLQMQQRGGQDSSQQQTKQQQQQQQHEQQQGRASRGEAEGSETAAAALSFSIKSSHHGRGPQQQRPTQQHWQQRQPAANGSRPDAAAAAGGVCSQAAAGAVADGSWVALIGLSQHEVDAVRQQLLQLLAAAPGPEDPASVAPAAAS